MACRLSVRRPSSHSSIELIMPSYTASTVIIDSYFWKQWPLWPELHGILFNVIQGKSSEWGVRDQTLHNTVHINSPSLHQVSPFYSYFLVHLPKLLLTALPLAILGVLVDHRQHDILLSATIFISLLSSLAHKEWRFIIYTVPFFNLSASVGASYTYVRSPSLSCA